MTEEPPSAEVSSDEEDKDISKNADRQRTGSIQLAKSKFDSKGALHSPVGSAHSFDLQVMKGTCSPYDLTLRISDGI